MVTIVAIVLQFIALLATGTWFVSEFKGQIEANSAAIAENNTEIEDLHDEVDDIKVSMGGQAVQLGRIEENILSIRSSINRLIRAVEFRNGNP